MRHVVSLYDACRDGGTAPRHEFLFRRRAAPDAGAISLYRDGFAVLRHVSPGLAIAHLAWEVNQGALNSTTGRLLLHAAAAEHNGDVVLFPGPQGSGKSTLVAALVQAGFRYVSDEIAAIDPDAGVVDPYPKPISLRPGSWRLLPELEPPPEPALAPSYPQWLIAPAAIRFDAVAAAGGRPRVLMFPTHASGPTRVEPISRSEALVSFIDQVSNFDALGRGALHLAADVVRSCRCYRLHVGDVREASTVVRAYLPEPLATK